MTGEGAGPPAAADPGEGAGRPAEAGPDLSEATGDARTPWRLWDHIGVLSGWVLGLAFVALLGILAAAGDPAVIAVLVTIVIGVAMIFLGLKMRGSAR